MQPMGRKRARESEPSNRDATTSAGAARELGLAASYANLDPDQQRAVDMVMAGKNVFVTGGPGAGKSYTLRVIKAMLEERRPGEVLVVSPTGVAALIIGGQTLHSKPGPGIPKGSTKAFGNMASRTSRQMWTRVKVLIVDEVSMVDAEFIDWYLEKAGVDRLQLVLCGDFAQLRPVPEDQGSLDNPHVLARCLRASAAVTDRWATTPFGLKESSGHSAFQTAFWRRANPQVALLRACHRTNDDLLLRALADIRVGVGDSPAVEALLKETRAPLELVNGVAPTKLYARKVDVRSHNSTALGRLPGSTAHHYRATDTVVPLDRTVDRPTLENDGFFRECQAVGGLELREGAQVMLVKNEEAGQTPRLVNGSRGIVVDFKPAVGGTVEYPVVRFACGREELIEPAKFEKELYQRGALSRIQVPLALAWALTVHKAQGASIDLLEVDLDGTFADGQTYVAVSRASSISGLRIVNFSPSCVRACPMIAEFSRALDEGRMAEFVASVPTWWAGIARRPEWLELYRRHPTFRRWADRHPQPRVVVKE